MFGRKADPAVTLTVSAEDVLKEEVDLSGYPHRHLAILGHATAVSRLLWAVEILARSEWELVSVSQFQELTVARGLKIYAIMRR